MAEQGDTTGKSYVVDPAWRDYLTQCAAVTVHCSRMRAEQLLTLDVLGIVAESDKEAKAIQNIVQLGYQLSLPVRVKTRGQQLENKFRFIHRKHTLNTEAGRIISSKSYPNWLKESEAVRKEYLNWAAWVAAHWDALQAEVEHDLRILGAKSYHALQAAGRQPLGERSDWIDAFVRRAMRKLGTKEQWLNAARMSWNVGYIPLAAQINQASPVTEPQNALQAAVIADQANQLTSGLFDFQAQCRGSLASMVLEAIEDCLKSYQSTGSINRPTVRRLKHLISRVDGLCFWAEPTITGPLAVIDSAVEVKPEARDDEKIARQMQTLAQTCASMLKELGQAHNRKGRQVPEHEDDFSEMFAINRAERQALPFEDDELDMSSINRASRQTGEVEL